MTRPGSLHIVILVLACLLAVCHGLWYWTDTIDDAYISFRYAANLAAGHGLVFNPGEQVEGYSNLLWTLGAALAIILGIDPMLAAKLAGMASTVLSLLVLDRLLVRTVRSRAARLGGLGLAVLAVPPAFWAMQGMETPLFTLLLCLSFYRFGEELDRSRGFPWSALLFALACLTRPEGPLYLAVFAGVRLARGRRPWRRDLCWLLAALLPLAVHLVWRLAYYGELLPNTWYAKGTAGSGFSFQAHAAGLSYIGGFLATAWWVPLILGGLGCVAALLAFRPRKGVNEGPPEDRRAVRSRLLLPVLWFAATLFFAWHANGDWMPNVRFLVPGVPALALLAAVGIDFAARRVGRPAAVPVSFILAALLLAALLAEAGVKKQMRPFSLAGGHQPRLLPMALYLMETLRDGETVVYGDIGIVGYLNPELRIIDNRGLTHRTMARLIFNRPHRMDEVRRLKTAFLDEFAGTRPEAAVVVVNRKARVPVWQTEIYGLHRGFQRNYTEARRLTHRRRNTELVCLRNDLIHRKLGLDEVIAHYRRAIELAPRISELYIRLAGICEASGNQELRRETLQAAGRRFAGNQAVIRRLEEAGR